MADRRTFLPRLEAVESRALLSTVAPVMSHPAAVAPAATSTSILLQANFQGRYTPGLGAPVLTLSASRGTLAPYGAGTVSGTVDPFGTTFSGRPPGLITITTARGHLNLSLYAPTTTGLPAPPGIPLTIARFALRIDGGDGVFARATGQGTAYLAFNEVGGFSIVFSVRARRV